MLILARKVGEAIVIDNEITVRVLEIKGSQIKLGVEAPSRVRVHREEIYNAIMEENIRAGMEAPPDLTALSGALESDGWESKIVDEGLLGRVADEPVADLEDKKKSEAGEK